MKTSAEKSSSTTSKTAAQLSNQPFFAKAGGGNFFEPAKQSAMPTLQMKMAVNEPGDKFEQEADKMADKVMRMTPPSPEKEEKLQRQPEEKLQKTEQEKIQKTGMPEEKLQKAEMPEEKFQKKEEKKLQKAAQPEEKLQKTEEEKIQKAEPEEKLQKAEDDKLQKAKAPEEKLQKAEEEKLQKAVMPEEKLQKKEDEKLQKAQAPGEKLQRAEHGRTPSVSNGLQSAIQNRTSGGQPLSSNVRNFMEPRFGADFSNVRVHNDAEAANMSQQVSARAFTYQSHIFFSRDQYQPEASEGKQLLAHELTHTLQQGAVARRKPVVSTVQTPVIQRGAIDWIKNKIKSGLNWAAERIIPGYTLLNVILGKNLITDETVSRSGVNIIRGYMRLSPIIGSILLSELEETETLPEAGAWVEVQVKQFGINFDDIAKRLEMAWDEMSIWRGIDYNVEIFKKYVGPVINPFMAFSNVVMGKVKELRLEGALRLVGATQLLTAIKKDPGAFKRLVDDPKLILKYFMNALNQGFTQFKGNFVTHFKNALFGWLFGKAAEMGIQMPKELSAAGLFHLIAQIVGVTYQQIRARIAQKLGPKGNTIISAIEKSVDIVKDLIARGPIALWEHLKKFLADFKEMVFAKIAELVSFEIIKAAVLKLVSMLNPVGALVQLVLGIYRVVKFFIDWWDRIKAIANAILDSIVNVALGNIAGAANYIESIMAKGVTLVIAFLANIFGLSGIVDKVRALIKKISDPIQLAIGKVVDWIVDKGMELLKKAGTAVLQAGVPQDPNERLRLGMQAAASAVNRFAGKKIGRVVLEPLLIGIRTRYGFKSLELREKNAKWSLTGVVNPTLGIDTDAEVAGIVLPSPVTPTERTKIAAISGGSAQLKKLDDIIAGGGQQAKIDAELAVIRTALVNTNVKYIGLEVFKRGESSALTEIDILTDDEMIEVKTGDYGKESKLSGRDMNQFTNTKRFFEAKIVVVDINGMVIKPPRKWVYQFTKPISSDLYNWLKSKGVTEVRTAK